MIERQVKVEDHLTPSPEGLQPRAYFTMGAGLYHLECSASKVRTEKFAKMHDAVAHWEKLMTENVIDKP